MHRIMPKLVLSLACITWITTADARQSEIGDLTISEGAIVSFHLVKTYESCPVGTVLHVKISAAVDSHANKGGDAVHGVLAQPLACNDRIILAAGTHVSGNFGEFGGQGNTQATYYGIEIKMVEAGEKSRWIDAMTAAPRASAPTNSVAIQKGARKKAPETGAKGSRPAEPSPMSWWAIMTASAKGTPQATLAAEIHQRGIGFYFDDGDVEGLRLAGANDEVLRACREARYIYVDYAADSDTQKRENEDAEKVFGSLAVSRSNAAGARLFLGMALNREGKYQDAVTELRSAIVLRPDLATAHEQLAESLYSTGKRDEAITELRESIRLFPNAPTPHILLGLRLAESGDNQSALTELQEAVRIAPNYYYPHGVLGEFLLEQKNTDEAVHELREAVQLNPSTAQCHFALGRAYFAKKDYDGAALELREATRLHPKSAPYHVWLAGALYNAGQAEESEAEAREALFYDAKANDGKLLLNSARNSLNASATSANVSQPSAPPPPQAMASGPLAGSTWACEWRKDFPENYVTTQPRAMSYSITFLESGIVSKNGTTWTDIGTEASWRLNGTRVTILTPGNAAANFEGTLASPTTIEAHGVFKENSVDVHDEFLNCARQTQIAPPASAAPVHQDSPADSNHPPYDDKCIRLGGGNLGAVTFTNICSEPIDLKWCYRKHGSDEAWTCQVTLKLLQNHTLSSPFCYQCSYDGRAATYLSSRNLSSMLPSDQEVASWADSGAPQFGSANSANSGVPNDGMRRWKIVNPSQNWDTVYLEVRGRSGDSTSDDWNDETPVNTLSLAPGAQQLLTCGQWFSLDIRWYTTSSSNPQTDVYYVSLICYANNFVWNNNHNLREYDFPRQ